MKDIFVKDFGKMRIDCLIIEYLFYFFEINMK